MKKDIDWLEKRLENQLRIHCKWLKNSDPEGVTKFIMVIIKNNEIEIDEKEQD
jgi:hypothetical protein